MHLKNSLYYLGLFFLSDKVKDKFRKFIASEGVTEQLKAENPIEWVRSMDGIRARVTEVVSSEVILN